MTSAIAKVRRGPLRAVAHMVTTPPLVPRDFLDLVDPLGSSRDLRGRIDAVTSETDDTVTVHIRVGGAAGRDTSPASTSASASTSTASGSGVPIP